MECNVERLGTADLLNILADRYTVAAGEDRDTFHKADVHIQSLARLAKELGMDEHNIS